MSDLGAALESEITRFSLWADSFPISERSGEWESLYPSWQEIYLAFSAFVDASTCPEWDEALLHKLLYIIARDNEMQRLIKDVARKPNNLVCLAQRALTSPERDAKWQLATELSHLDRRMPQVESVLLQFVHDTDEYVRRRSLIALADIESPQVEELAKLAWNTGDEYQRMAALYALWRVGSAQLDTYLTLADVDGSHFLATYAARIRSGNPD